MASDVSGAKAAIYSRLATAPTFHPANASLFEDWTLQGGDIITVTSDSDSYSLPIYGMRMRWNGGTKVSVESTGNEARDAVEKMAQRESARAVSGYRSGIKTAGVINYHAEQLSADGSILYQAGLQLNAQGVLIYADTSPNMVGSKLGGLHGEIQVQAGRIGLVVEGTGANAHIKPAAIVASINEQTGTSQALISADKILLDGDTTLHGMMTISSGSLMVSGNVYAGLSGENYFQGTKLRLVGGSSSQGAQVEELTATSIADMIIKAQVSGNELKLWKKGDSPTGNPSITFSKATSLSGEWGSSSGSPTGVFTVTATQNNVEVGSVLTSVTQGAVSWSGNTGTIPIKATIGTGATLYDVKNVTVDASPRYYAGSAAVNLAEPTWNAVTGEIGASRTATVSTTGRVNSSGTTDNLSKQIALTLSPSGLTVYLQHNSTSVAKATCSDANLVAGNIKSGVTIFGVTGSYSGGTVTWPSVNTSTANATFTAGGETRTYTVSAPYTIGNDNYAVLLRNGEVFAAANIQASYNNIYSQAYIAGWNAYYNQNWYIPTDSGSGGQFKIPSTADSGGNWSYINWSRATDLYNNPSWSYPNAISTGSSQPTGVDKMYSASAAYRYFWFTVTVNGSSKKFCIHTTT